MAEGSTAMSLTERSANWRFCQPLSSGSQLVYLEGLNGCQVPVIMTLPESLSNSMTMLEGESTFLQVDLSQSAIKEQESKALSLGGGLSPTPPASPTRAFPHKVEGQISMTMEASELLSWAVLDTAGLASRSSTPKRPGSLALATLLPLSQGTPPNWWILPLKWVHQRTWRWIIPPWRRSMPLCPLVKTPELSSEAPS